MKEQLSVDQGAHLSYNRCIKLHYYPTFFLLTYGIRLTRKIIRKASTERLLDVLGCHFIFVTLSNINSKPMNALDTLINSIFTGTVII